MGGASREVFMLVAPERASGPRTETQQRGKENRSGIGFGSLPDMR